MKYNYPNDSDNWFFNYQNEKNSIIRELGKGIITKIYVANNSMLSFVKIESHTKGTIHSHPEEQWGLLLEGECIRIQDKNEIKMKKGDFWYTPPDVPHGIRTEDTQAFILDIFSPPRAAYRSSGRGF